MPLTFTIRAHEVVQAARLQEEIRQENRRFWGDLLDAQITRDLDRFLRERLTPPVPARVSAEE